MFEFIILKVLVHLYFVFGVNDITIKATAIKVRFYNEKNL